MTVMAGYNENSNHFERSARQDRLDWQSDALCAQTNPELFVLDKGEKATEAKKICGKCDVGLQCLHSALQANERKGIMGGMTVSERDKINKTNPKDIETKYFAVRAINRRLK